MKQKPHTIEKYYWEKESHRGGGSGVFVFISSIFFFFFQLKTFYPLRANLLSILKKKLNDLSDIALSFIISIYKFFFSYVFT